jgi:hypothetical protein
VYVPYGAFLVRTLALFHGGHYGSVGNTRYHATFTLNKSAVVSEELAYLRNVRNVEGFEYWKLRWNPSIGERCRTPGGYKWHTNNRIKSFKDCGARYAKVAIGDTASPLYPIYLSGSHQRTAFQQPG